MSPEEERQPEFAVSRLLAWYRAHRRDLPWRPRKKSAEHPGRTVTPYATLVSEQMCQQTQVATVIPYFHRFLEAFPTVEALAAADEQAVLKLWQGLGYYRRARSLHAAAKMVVDEFCGVFPDDVEALLKLPGVGRYTAGAVASIAFDAQAPVLDGNVMRVLARHDGIAEPVDRPATQKRLWARARELVGRVPQGSRGDFNQALMELGATVCTPQPGSAKCMYCPLRETCTAYAVGSVDALPVKTPKKKPTAVTHEVLAIFRNEKLLFEQRPSTGLWASMWQLPTLESLTSRDRQEAGKPAASEHPAPSRSRLVRHVLEAFGLKASIPREVGRFDHATTHRAITFVVYRCEVEGGRLRAKSGVWRRVDGVEDLPLSKPQVRALRLVGGDGVAKA